MLATFARQALLLVHVLTAAVWLPLILDMAFDQRLVRTIILHSPVLDRFLFIEYVPSWLRHTLPPEEAKLMEHGMIHRTEDRTPISREAFENALPFIYSEGMRLRGLLPVTINGHEYDLEALRRGKTILGVAAADPDRSRLVPPLHALLDSRPDRVSLTFPEDRFRLRNGLEFVNADTNSPNREMHLTDWDTGPKRHAVAMDFHSSCLLFQDVALRWYVLPRWSIEEKIHGIGGVSDDTSTHKPQQGAAYQPGAHPWVPEACVRCECPRAWRPRIRESTGLGARHQQVSNGKDALVLSA